MKKMLKLVPALCMLLISAMVLGTSTYAWFSMNTTVTARNMQVTAVSEGGIVIGAYTYEQNNWVAPVPTAFKNIVDAAFPGMENGNLLSKTLVPTSTTKIDKWYHATSNDVNNYAATSEYSNISFAANNSTDYYLYNKFQIKSLEDSGSATSIERALYVSNITISGNTTSAELNKSLRVAVRVNGTTTYFFAPLYESITENSSLYQYGIAGDATDPYRNNVAYLNGTLVIGATPNKLIASAIGTTTPTEIEIFIYYEGEDENCMSINAVNIAKLNVSVSFSTVSGS